MFVILSDKYLKSPNCMYELLECGETARRKMKCFASASGSYRLPDAKMMGPNERYDCAEYWDDEFKKLDARVRKNPSLLAKADFNRYKLMHDFARHVGDMLALIADTGIVPKRSSSNLTLFSSGQVIRHEHFLWETPGKTAPTDPRFVRQSVKFVHYVSRRFGTVPRHLQPRDFDQLVKYGFGDEMPSASSK